MSEDSLMESSVRWYYEDKIVGVVSAGELSVEDVRNMAATINSLIGASESPLVHVIIDETNLISMPTNIKQIVDATSTFLSNPQLGWFIIYGNDNMILKFVGQVATSMKKLRHRRFSTLHETLEFLISVDVSLPSIEELMK